MKEELSKALSASSEVAEALKSIHSKLAEEVTESVKKLIREMVEEQLKAHGLKVNTDNAAHDDPLVNQPASS